MRYFFPSAILILILLGAGSPGSAEAQPPAASETAQKPDSPSPDQKAGAPPSSPKLPALDGLAVEDPVETFTVGCEETVEMPAERSPPIEPQDDKEALLGRATPSAPRPSTGSVIKIILGFVLLFALAYVGGHPALDLERRLNVSHLVATGLPFIVLGLVAGHPAVGILNQSVLSDIRPLITMGLGWIGFAVGFRFDARHFAAAPPSAMTIVVLMTALPAALITLASYLLLDHVMGDAESSTAIWRDALLLGVAGAMTATSAGHLLEARNATREAIERVDMLVHLEQLAGIVGLMMLAAYFRPQGGEVAWQLPGTAWLLLTVGVGTLMGFVTYAVLNSVKESAPWYLVLIGSLAFSAGVAGYLRLSPVVVCFIAGCILVNFPSSWKEQLGEALLRLERPVYFLFLIIAGALWRETAWQGWALMGLFVIMRFAAKWLGMEVFRRSHPQELENAEQRTLVVAPMGALSIAIVVTAQALYFGPTVPWIVTAVIGGAIVMELVLQLATRGRGLGVRKDEHEVHY